MSGHMQTSDGHHRVVPIGRARAKESEAAEKVASKFKCAECGAEFRSQADAESHEANRGWES